MIPELNRIYQGDCREELKKFDSNALAAIREGHPWHGIELLPAHVAIAQARIDAETDGKLF